MDIYESLKTDHDKLKGLLSQLVALPDDDREGLSSLVKQIRDELVPHSRAEESVLYNSLRTVASETHPVWHGYNEHLMAETLLRALQVEDTVNLGWRATAEKLKDALEHHIQEEEDEIFSLAKKHLSPSEAQMLGTAFRSLKPEIKEEGVLKTTLDMMVNLMPPRFAKAIGADKGLPEVGGNH